MIFLPSTPLVCRDADNYYDRKFSPEVIFNRPVDLPEEKAIKNTYFRQSVNQ